MARRLSAGWQVAGWPLSGGRPSAGWLYVWVGIVVLAGCSSDKPGPTQTTTEVPKAATGLYCPRTAATSILLRWKDNSDSEYGFRIERRADGSGDFVALPDTVPANRITFEDFSVDSAAAYTYRVVSYNGAGDATPSNDLEIAAVPNRSPRTPARPAPEDGAVEIDPQSALNLSWSASDPDADPLTFDVLFGTDLRMLDVLAAGQADSSYVVPGPFNRNAHYFWQIIVHDPAGVATPSPVWGFSTEVDRLTIPAGRFIMGDRPEFGSVDDLAFVHPGNPIFIEAFDIDRFEVNNQQFADFLNAMLDRDSLKLNPDRISDATGAQTWAVIRPTDVDSDIFFSVEDSAFIVLSGRENFPVVQVSWYGADAYAHHYHRRLPTEAEWEKAARGVSRSLGWMIYSDSTTVDTVGVGFPFPWGTQQDLSRGNFLNSGDPYENQGRVRSTPTDFYVTGDQDEAVHEGYTVHSGKSPFGVESMAGNVWEWCQDWYGPYQSPHEPPAVGSFKIIRGGSYNQYWSSATTWNRSFVGPETCDRAFGFRTAGSILIPPP